MSVLQISGVFWDNFEINFRSVSIKIYVVTLQDSPCLDRFSEGSQFSFEGRKEKKLPHIFAYKTEFFSFQNNPKNLDLSYKTDLDLWDCLGRVKLVLQPNCIGLIWLFVLILE